MLTLFRRAALMRPTLVAVRASSSTGPASTPDTGGPLFSHQLGTSIHTPASGGDKAAAPREKAAEEEVDDKHKSKAHKVRGGHSFAELKRFRQEGRD
ncbi:hypothetical protein CspeluHIS016_0800610 [Cutaneotrichosporon spelunceum]|uniref:Uncharacterized protein n=1 Tax=Cutaneotrichosporon spelunceum TaxID=1672016 RepID=A0AAD3TZQ0_9TREE|nr:hypothetical protein CspeluHIS016_0800610 [Cutaneotrichosporon spelunceum]